MPSLATDGAVEDRFIPEPARRIGLLQCFAYQGRSMAPTFRAGQLLYVRPTGACIEPGDVVVYRHGDLHVVHRVVSIAQGRLVTRGDACPQPDACPVVPEQLIGRVEMLEDHGRLRPVRGGHRGLWRARTGWVAREARTAARPLRALYCGLRGSPVVRSVLNAVFGRGLTSVRVETPDGPIVKYLWRGRVVARWWADENRFECRKPFDLLIAPPVRAGPTQGPEGQPSG